MGMERPGTDDHPPIAAKKSATADFFESPNKVPLLLAGSVGVSFSPRWAETNSEPWPKPAPSSRPWDR
jgi:hypothetical protein